MEFIIRFMVNLFDLGISIRKFITKKWKNGTSVCRT